MLVRQCIRGTNWKSLVNKRTVLTNSTKTIRCICCDYFSKENSMKRPLSTTSYLRIAGNQSLYKSLTADKTVTSEELLEKLVAGMSTDIHQKNRIYKNDLQKVLKKVKELNFSTKKQGLLFLHCCGELLPDETPASRMQLVEEVWNIIKPHTKFTVEHYNELLNVYIANNRTLTASTFIQKMQPIVPNIKTYELLLRALGEAGDLNQSTEVIANMKAQGIPATENIFNSLIICQGKLGNIANIQEVLTMMKSLQLDKSIDTYTALARAMAWNRKMDKMLDEMNKAVEAGLKFTEHHIMEIVKILARMEEHSMLPQVLKFLPDETKNLPSISPYMQSVATLLVFQNHPMAALELYKCLPLPSFGPKDDKGLHGRSLVRDCVKASMPTNVIGLITQELMSTGRNPIALQNASEAALQLGKIPLAIDLFMRMKQVGIPIRPHYFWPVFLQNSKTCGEKGIMNTLETMVTMDVLPDYDTVLEYVLPYVSFTSPQNLMKKFQETGISVSTVLTPMMVTLLNSGQVRAASEICELFSGKVDAERIIKPLVRGYLTNSDVTSTTYILEDLKTKAVNKDKDWTGRMLCELIQHRKVQADLIDFMAIVKELKARSLKISTSAVDYIMSRIPPKHSEAKVESIRNILIDMTDERMIDEGDMFANQIPHPKSMNEESLRAHLNELEAKGMNTRGVLRKLLQIYCRSGNLNAAREIVDKCQKEGVFLSAGMKASIFDLHVKLGELELAEISLAELNKSSPNFTLDEFKIIDFATLMVFKKRIDMAMDLITEQSKKRRVVGGRSVEVNCWRLLDATATHGDHIQTQSIFDLLVSYGYCKPSNVMLGPLIRVHLKNGNIQEAVKEFNRLSNEYNKTPLKHELLTIILKEMSDGFTEDNFLNNEKINGRLNKMAQSVLAAVKRVHGPSDLQLTLIAALADVGYKKTLRKTLLDPQVRFHPDAFRRRCEKFADEKNVKALECLAVCSKDLRHVNAAEIYEMILDVYQRDDNHKEATALWSRILESNITPTDKFIRNLVSMLKANNRPIPSDLVILIGKKKVTNV